MSNYNKEKDKNNENIKLDDSTLNDVDSKLYSLDKDEEEKIRDFYKFDKNSLDEFKPIGTVGDDFNDEKKKTKELKKPKNIADRLNSKEKELAKTNIKNSEHHFVDEKVKEEIISIFENDHPIYEKEHEIENAKNVSPSNDEVTIFEDVKNDNITIELDENKIKSLMESAFYVYGHEGLSLNDLKKLTLAPTPIIKKILKQWIETLENDPSKGIVIKMFGEKYKFFTKPSNREELSRLITIKYRNPLSQKVMETLAIIAYNQPCTKAIIENIRGKDPTMTIQKLIDLGLVIEAGRGDGPGRPLLFTVTHKFYDIFGIKNISDLPTINLEQPFQDDDISFFDTTRFSE